MKDAALALCEDISTARFAYGQSDEISVLLTDYDTFQTNQWFDGKVQKIVSVAASIATLAFNKAFRNTEQDGAMFDFDGRQRRF